MNKQQLQSLGDMVRTTPTAADPAILWAVRHHLALFLYGIDSAERCLEALIMACNTLRDDGIISRIGLDGLEAIKGARIARLSRYSTEQYIMSEDTPNDI
jgi:hypothetical protein